MAKVVIILGPTGVGKSVLALELAQKLGQTLFYFEPVLAYKELCIGSAKPSVQERARVPHVGIDLTDLKRPLTLMDMYHQVVPEITRQAEKTGLAIVVTGSGFFLRALMQGVPRLHAHGAGHVGKDVIFRDITGHDYPVLGEAVSDEDRSRCYETLKQLWPKRALKVHPHDIYRILRSLEVARNNFEDFAELKEQSEIEALGTESLLPPQIEKVLIGLKVDEGVYEERLRDRVKQMLAAGWVEEVRGLLDRGFPLQGALKSVGYRELYGWLKSKDAQDDEEEAQRRHPEHSEGSRHDTARSFVLRAQDDGRKRAQDEGTARSFSSKMSLLLGTARPFPSEMGLLLEILARSHRQLSRKQMKWFRRFEGIHWLNSSQMPLDEQVSFVIECIG